MNLRAQLNSLLQPAALLQPDYIERCVEEIDLEAWWQVGLRGLILDVDDTLTRKNSPYVASPVMSWLQAAQKRGFQCLIVSNNRYPEHIEAVSQKLGIPAVARAGKPRSAGFLWAQREMDLKPEQIVVIGDRVLTDILGGASLGMKTCLVLPVTKKLSWRKRSLYAFEQWLSQSLHL